MKDISQIDLRISYKNVSLYCDVPRSVTSGRPHIGFSFSSNSKNEGLAVTARAGLVVPSGTNYVKAEVDEILGVPTSVSKTFYQSTTSPSPISKQRSGLRGQSFGGNSFPASSVNFPYTEASPAAPAVVEPTSLNTLGSISSSRYSSSVCYEGINPIHPNHIKPI